MRLGTIAAVAIVLGTTAGTVETADAVADAKTTVTIRAEGTDLSGTVKSPRPIRCAKDRNVIVIKQIGERGGGDDVRFAHDTAELNGDVYEWSTGTTGTPGRFYARVRPIDGCLGDTSKTIRARRTVKPTAVVADGRDHVIR